MAKRRPDSLGPGLFTDSKEDERVYGGDCNLIHVEDGKRTELGARVANYLDVVMRHDAWERRARSRREIESQPLCPGCYMVVGFNAMLTLARANGQSVSELGRTMSAAFKRLEECGDDAACIEEIEVMLDPDISGAPL